MSLTDAVACQPLDLAACRVLADALGDTPETVIAAHALRRGLCRAYVAGQPAGFDGAVVQADFAPTEPTGFGSDPHVLWRLLRAVEGWDCVDVDAAGAPALGEIIQREMGVGVRYYGDIYYTLTRPAARFYHLLVRRLTLADLTLLEAAPRELQGAGFGSPRGLLTEGVVAGAVVEGRVVAIAHTSSYSERHADVGVFTHPGWRGRGLATAAAALVVRQVQAAGRTPVWSAGEDNFASLRVAHKLGFVEVSRRTYVILER